MTSLQTKNIVSDVIIKYRKYYTTLHNLHNYDFDDVLFIKTSIKILLLLIENEVCKKDYCSDSRVHQFKELKSKKHERF